MSATLLRSEIAVLAGGLHVTGLDVRSTTFSRGLLAGSKITTLVWLADTSPCPAVKKP